MKVGDRVKIKEDSKWYEDTIDNPINIIGTILHHISKSGFLPIRVRWDNGKTNSYDLKDLELVEESIIYEIY